MNFPLYVARRYFFSKKSHNVINIISLVTISGIAIATLAAVCILSVFNGFHDLISKTFGAFDPELKITSVREKVFDPTSSAFLKIYKLPEVALVSETLEDNVLVKYNQQQLPVLIKGVSNNFNKLINFGDIIFNEKFKLINKTHSFAVLGIGVAKILNVDDDSGVPLCFYAPKRENKNYKIAVFNEKKAYVSGIFMVNQPIYDDNYVIVPINFVRQLLGYKTKISALEIKLKNPACILSIKKKIRQILKENFSVKDRYEQQETAFNMVSIEKLITFLLLCFIFSIVTFNLIGSLNILIVDKQKDIYTFRAIGADKKLIIYIFLLEGCLMAILGCISGIFLGVFICFLQKQFGIIHLGSDFSFLINTYPVQIKINDLVLIFSTVLMVSFTLVFYFIKCVINKYFQKF
ncbi:MAG: ABC transporter permease [Bacteroidales bacterium OttesenSCG-928-I14]|jgi:ABC-type lipoprotein release transport system permease subunit|nr:ABC transporter permease [Bacteroidales bacterium OttesenSCG-928-I14]